MDEKTEQGSFIFYLHELRRRLIFCLISIAIIFSILVFFSNDLYLYFANPLLKHLPSASSMIATSVMSPLIAPLKLAFVMSIFMTIPILLYHLWAFIAPGLYEKERKLVAPLVTVSAGLFYLGVLFAYYVTLPLMFSFLVKLAPKGIIVMPDMNAYLSLVLKLFFAFGVSFEVPVLVFLLVKTGFTSVEKLQSQRSYVIVGAFILGMLLTPPDVVSQTMLALPIWFLFEIGLYFTKVLTAREDRESAKKEGEHDNEENRDL